jgi:aminopeptidase N
MTESRLPANLAPSLLNQSPTIETPMTSAEHRPVYLKDYAPPRFLIDTVELDVRLDPKHTRVASTLVLKPNAVDGEAPSALVLDGQAIELECVQLDGRLLASGDYDRTDRSLTIHRCPDKPFTLKCITYCSPEDNHALTGLYRSRGIYCTQCEAEGFRRITYYLDRPDVLAVFTTRIEAERNDAPVLLANGNCVSSGRINRTGRHFAVWNDPYKKPSYLFAMVGGKLGYARDTFATASGRKVELRIYVEPGKEDRCGWAMDCLKRAMRWDEVRFGREYDLDIFMIVAVSDFNMGAMENKGLNIFNDKLILASPETATDANFEAIESVIAHEYFHNWTGDRITCRDWFQLCLKEGLTVFRDQEFSADERSRMVQRVSDVRALRASQFPEDAGPLAHPVRPASYIEINNFYTATVYEKGAEVCRMLQTMLGVDGFRKGMDLYFERHDGEATTVECFIKCFEDACGVDLSQFMLWYNQSGTPELLCDLSFDQRAKTAELSIEQVLAPTPGQPKKQPFMLPFAMGLLAANGTEIPLALDSGAAVEGDVVVLRNRKTTLKFKNVTSRPVASLLRGFSAPVNVRFEQSDTDLEFLMVHDRDLFNRWEAAQTLSTRYIKQAMVLLREGSRPRPRIKLANALGVTLQDASLEPAFRALFAALPSEADIARSERQNVDPAAIHKARNQIQEAIGKQLHELLTELYAKNQVRGKYTPDAASSGQRALRAAALQLIVARGEPEDISLAATHFKRASNMTDQLTSLSLLADLETPERETALDRFEAAWADDPLVMDKWFSVQALSSRPDTLEVVERLTKHPLFSLRNPNKVRALVGSFASGNQLNFNREDGAGYGFVVDKVLEIDKFNPQIAARLLGAFRSFRTLEPKRRKLAKAALTTVASRPGLSRDVHEIVTRTLGGREKN